MEYVGRNHNLIQLADLNTPRGISEECLLKTIITGNLEKCEDKEISDNILDNLKNEVSIIGGTKEYYKIYNVSKNYEDKKLSIILDYGSSVHNDRINKIIKEKDNNTFVLIIGKGDSDSRLSVYSIKDAYNLEYLISNKTSMILNIQKYNLNDLAPTLATILSIPLPFTNFGLLIPPLVPCANSTNFVGCNLDRLIDVHQSSHQKHRHSHQVTVHS